MSLIRVGQKRADSSLQFGDIHFPSKAGILIALDDAVEEKEQLRILEEPAKP